ncbi:MAG: hypothetical protein K6T35_05450, partial [Meiothermus silvanus]|nr:hypothetical protein [Allomeiothermus silvanus]
PARWRPSRRGFPGKEAVSRIAQRLAGKAFRDGLPLPLPGRQRFQGELGRVGKGRRRGGTF